jgi:hypothetical protein
MGDNLVFSFHFFRAYARPPHSPTGLVGPTGPRKKGKEKIYKKEKRRKIFYFSNNPLC